jgi:hypothetical protein
VIFPVARHRAEDFTWSAYINDAAETMAIIIHSGGLFVFDKSQPQPAPRSARMPAVMQAAATAAARRD